ncbi:helix-turn-helix domain-containing protein [Paenibacillus sp. MBLB4367]|uniref:helix-turn-helix domain-containing protein n=1 Tax=Paenibacillus sp. MBLB4367 TaxID=3384767 RepID=UPI003907EB60
MMKKIVPMWKSKSLFTMLLISFLTIIGLLVSFAFFSSFILKNKIYDEIIKYNDANLETAVAGYEKQFKFVSTTLLNFYINDKVSALRKMTERTDYVMMSAVRAELQASVSNPFLFLDNIILYFKRNDMVLEKEGTNKAETMFAKFYKSDRYPPEYWKRQFEESYNSRMLPSAPFVEVALQANHSKGTLLPLIVKSKFVDDMYMIAMLDADRLFQSLHASINRTFYILDADGQLIYSSALNGRTDIPVSFEWGERWTKRGTDYFFYQKGPETGFTYVNIIPAKSISSQLLKLNSVLVILLIVSVAISIGASVLFTIRFNNPIQKMIRSVLQLNRVKPLHSRIQEFDLLSSKIGQILESNENINNDLVKKNSLLRTYAFTNRIKEIYMNAHDFGDLAETDKPFVFILFRFRFKEEPEARLQDGTNKELYFFREYIDLTLTQNHKETVTFQTEKDRILSVVSVNPDEADVADTLEQIIRPFEADRTSCIPTIALSDIYPDSSHFTKAYEQVQIRIGMRVLNDEIQIIDRSPAKQPKFAFTGLQEHELEAKLTSGSEEAAFLWMKRILEQMEKNQETAETVATFALETADLLNRIIMKVNGRLLNECEAPELVYKQIKGFYSYRQFEKWFENLLQSAVHGLKKASENRDPIISYVFHYLENHYNTDISLDMLSEHLNITANYLSTYFKDKTGLNISDCLNDLRVRKAKEMLCHVDHKIVEIATNVGYQNVNSFIRMFKRFTGVTPGEFRKMHAASPESSMREGDASI